MPNCFSEEIAGHRLNHSATGTSWKTTKALATMSGGETDISLTPSNREGQSKLGVFAFAACKQPHRSLTAYGLVARQRRTPILGPRKRRSRSP